MLSFSGETVFGAGGPKIYVIPPTAHMPSVSKEDFSQEEFAAKLLKERL
jgi:hypothetical protein